MKITPRRKNYREWYNEFYKLCSDDSRKIIFQNQDKLENWFEKGVASTDAALKFNNYCLVRQMHKSIDNIVDVYSKFVKDRYENTSKK